MPWESIRDDRGVARGLRGPSSRLGRRRPDPVDRDGDVRATTAGGHGSEQVPELLRHPLPWVAPSAPIIDVMSLRTGKRGPGAGSARWRTLPRRPLHLLSALPRTASRPVLCVRRRSGLVSWLETLVRHGDLEASLVIGPLRRRPWDRSSCRHPRRPQRAQSLLCARRDHRSDSLRASPSVVVFSASAVQLPGRSVGDPPRRS